MFGMGSNPGFMLLKFSVSTILTIHSKVRNRLASSSLEKLVCVYSNSKMVIKSRDDEELKMFASDNVNEDV